MFHVEHFTRSEKMPIYEYPPKLSRSQRQAKAAHDLAQHKRMRRNMVRNIAIAITIIAISFLVQAVLIKILLIVIAVANGAVGWLLYRYGTYSFDANVYTRIYKDHIEHSQRGKGEYRYLFVNIPYEDILSSQQDPRGGLVVTLKDDASAQLYYADSEKDEKHPFIPKDKTLTLRFEDTKAKLTLINDFYEQINYPHKEYNVIDDDDDDYYSAEDKKWDRLGKHGL